MSATIPCPDPDTLERLLLGQLNQQQADTVAAHVQQCPSCTTRVRQLGEHLGAAPQPNLTADAETATAAPATALPASAELPLQIGRYQLEGEIARGGMGRIVRVRDEDFDRPLALKIMLSGGGEQEERFVREARMTGLLQHPGIPPVHALGRLADGRPWFVMKLVEGRSLHALLAERPAPSAELPRFIGIFGQICQTVGFAHARGVIHRDLKPLNIMVGAFGEVQVMDWGLAKWLTDTRAEPQAHEPRPAEAIGSEMQTRAGSVLGTPAYMAPEQARGELDRVDARADVFGLGGILCTILTGQPPYVALLADQVYLTAVMGDLANAEARLARCGADPELVGLARRCLAVAPENRPANGAVVAQAVAAYQAELEQRLRQAEIDRAAEQARADGERSRRKAEEGRAQAERKRRRLALALAAAFVVLIAGGSAAALWYQADRVQRATELALQSETLNNEVGLALTEVSDRRRELHGILGDPQKVHELLSDIDRWQTMLREARAPWKRAQTLAQGAPELLDATLAAQLCDAEQTLDTDDRDWQLARRLDDIRQEGSSKVQGRDYYRGAAQKYPKVFVGDLDVLARAPDDVATFIARSPIRYALVAALDHWAQTTSDDTARVRILEVARKADPQPWGDRFRDVKVWADRVALEQLARELRPAEQSPQLIITLAGKLGATSGEALEVLRRALLHHPRDFWLHYFFAHFGKSPSERESRFQAALVLRPRSSIVHNSIGWALREQKTVDGAIAEFQKAIELGPDNALAYTHLGVALHDKQDVEGAALHHRKAIELEPTLAVAYTNLGNVLQEMKDVEGAIARHRKAIELDPGLALAHNNLGAALGFKKLQWKEAIPHLRKAIALDHDFAVAHSNLGAALFNANKDHEGAMVEFRKALALDPNLAVAHVNFGIVLTDKKDLAGALTHYRQAVELEPNDAKFHFQLAAALGKKDLTEAITHYRRAIELEPNYAKAHYNLGTALYDNKDWDAAIAHYRKAIELTPNDAKLHFNLANTLRAKNDIDGAIAEFRKAIDIDPDDVKSHRTLGAALMAKNDVDAAITHYRKALRIEPSAPNYSNLGNALFQKKDLDGAIEQCRKAVALDPGFAGAYANLGNALFMKKDMEGAIAQYRKAIELGPGNDLLHENLGYVLIAKKDLEGAITHLRKAIAINPANVGAGAKLVGALFESAQITEARRVTLELLKRLPPKHPWRPVGESLMRRSEALLGFETQLAAFVDRGEMPKATIRDQLAMAVICQRHRRYHAAAVRLYRAVFVAEPKLVDDLAKAHRYNAACSALLAAEGKGRDPKPPDDTERDKLRAQALDWLRADLSLAATRFRAGGALDVVLLLDKLPHWQVDPNLAGVRDAKALAALPAKDRDAWRALWADVEALLKEVRANVVETRFEGTLTQMEREQVRDLKMATGKTYVIDMHSTELDSYLKLLDADGKVLDEQDDLAPGNQDARLVYTPTEGGTFRIVATSFQQQGRGNYVLTVRAIAKLPR
jgi:tetratricopeptide (TPR) repeat protein